MARRKKSRFSLLTWLLFTAVSGGGIGGYFNPDLPVIGPLVKDFLRKSTDGEKVDQTALRESASDLVGQRLNDLRGGGVPAQLASAQHARLGSNRLNSARLGSVQFGLRSAQTASKTPFNNIILL